MKRKRRHRRQETQLRCMHLQVNRSWQVNLNSGGKLDSGILLLLLGQLAQLSLIRLEPLGNSIF